MPILWHIIIICLGYTGNLIKEYFANYFLDKSDVTIDLIDNSIKVDNSQVEPSKITLVDIDNDSLTGGPIKRIQSHVNKKCIRFLGVLSQINTIQ